MREDEHKGDEAAEVEAEGLAEGVGSEGLLKGCVAELDDARQVVNQVHRCECAAALLPRVLLRQATISRHDERDAYRRLY